MPSSDSLAKYYRGGLKKKKEKPCGLGLQLTFGPGLGVGGFIKFTTDGFLGDFFTAFPRLTAAAGFLTMSAHDFSFGVAAFPCTALRKRKKKKDCLCILNFLHLVYTFV